MPLYNVEVTQRTLMVVEAEDWEDAANIAQDRGNEAFNDDWMSCPVANVLGEVKSKDDLVEGWDIECTPYTESTRTDKTIEEILKGE